MSTAIGEILRSIVRKYGLEPAIHRERMPKYWAEVVGARIACISNVRSSTGWRARATILG